MSEYSSLASSTRIQSLKVAISTSQVRAMPATIFLPFQPTSLNRRTSLWISKAWLSAMAGLTPITNIQNILFSPWKTSSLVSLFTWCLWELTRLVRDWLILEFNQSLLLSVKGLATQSLVAALLDSMSMTSASLVLCRLFAMTLPMSTSSWLVKMWSKS